MEGYLRLGLLIIAAVIVFLILFEAWYRRRQTRLANMNSMVGLSSRIMNPDEILGLDQTDSSIEPEVPKIIPSFTSEEFTAATGKTPTLADDDTDTVEPLLQDIESGKLLYPYEKEAADFFIRHDIDISDSPIVKGVEDLSPHDINLSQSVTIDEEPPRPQAKSDLLVISVFAKSDDQFASYDLLQAIAATGMQFGEMNIFHYYAEDELGHKITLFNLVSATEPGDFDLDRMGEFSCIGLTLFLSLSQVPDPQQAFERMLTTAEQLADDLDGELRAGHRMPWNDDVLNDYLRKVAHYQTYNHSV
jgi:cell division protein ZipA